MKTFSILILLVAGLAFDVSAQLQPREATAAEAAAGTAGFPAVVTPRRVAGAVSDIRKNIYTYTTNYLYPPTTTDFITNYVLNLNTNVLYLKPAGSSGYTTPLVWSSSGFYTNATKCAGYVAGDAAPESGPAPFASLSLANADYFSGGNVTFVEGDQWDVNNGAAPAPIVLFATNSITTNILANKVITTNTTSGVSRALLTSGGIVVSNTDSRFIMPDQLREALRTRFFSDTNTVFMATNGNDTTGTRGVVTLPFRTLDGAYLACPSGGCIWFNNTNSSVVFSNFGQSFTFSKPLDFVIGDNAWTNISGINITNNIRFHGGLVLSAINMQGSNFFGEYVKIGQQGLTQNIDCFVGAGVVTLNNCCLWSTYDVLCTSGNFPTRPITVYAYNCQFTADASYGNRNNRASVIYIPTVAATNNFFRIKDSILSAVGSTNLNVAANITSGSVILDNCNLNVDRNFGASLQAGTNGTIYLLNMGVTPSDSVITNNGVITNLTTSLPR